MVKCQGKMNFGQGKVSEKSGILFQTKSGHLVMTGGIRAKPAG